MQRLRGALCEGARDVGSSIRSLFSPDLRYMMLCEWLGFQGARRQWVRGAQKLVWTAVHHARTLPKAYGLVHGAQSGAS